MESSYNSNPFGEVSWEAELSRLQRKYESYYFEDTPFNDLALRPENYLIVGRRGSGKSSIAYYLTFQRRIATSRCVDVREPEIYERVLARAARFAATSSELAIPRIAKIWSYIIWNIIFREYKSSNKSIAAAYEFGDVRQQRPARLVLEIISALLNRFLDRNNARLVDDLESFLSNPLVKKAQDAVLLLAQREPVIVAIDSLERYGDEDPDTMTALAGLVHAASHFNRDYSRLGIHVKIFVNAEIFPHLKETWIQNILKHVRNPLHLSWRSRDLVRLICWRFYHFLSANNILLSETGRMRIDWKNFDSVMGAIWLPHFGRQVSNANGRSESTVSYILRHSQLRPRQLILICNSIAKVAMEREEFPKFSGESILLGIREAERELSEEIFNSYERIYPNVSRIVEALTGSPMIFKANLLDRMAPRRAAAWANKSPLTEYSPLRFKDLLTDLGVIGRVRRKSIGKEFMYADFQYFIPGRLVITEDDICAVHPMFFRKLNIDTSEEKIVLPFPEHLPKDEMAPYMAQ